MFLKPIGRGREGGGGEFPFTDKLEDMVRLIYTHYKL